MKAVLLLAIALVALVCLTAFVDAAARKNPRNRKYDLSKKDTELFKDWLRDRPEKVKKLKLSRKELIDRFRKFQHNVKKAKALNVQSAGETEFGLTDLSDLDDNEFSKVTGARIPGTNKRDLEGIAQEPEVQKRDIEALPSSKDWRKSKKRVVAPVQNQGNCGSCWTFATAANIEGVWSVAGKAFVSLSEKHVLDCVRGPSNKGCNGGWMGTAYDYFIKNGAIRSDKYYPYKPKVGTCRKVGGPYAKIKSWAQIPKDHNQIKAALVKYGPLAVIVDASTWQNYRGGIFGSRCKASNPNHAVTLVGYGSKNGTPVWIIKNSWGTGWGINGYAFVKRGSSSACGIHNWVVTAKA